MMNDCKTINISFGKTEQIEVGLGKQQILQAKIGRFSGGGTGSYPPLSEKPSINNVVLLGNKTAEDLFLQEEIEDITEQDIDAMIYGI